MGKVATKKQAGKRAATASAPLGPLATSRLATILLWLDEAKTVDERIANPVHLDAHAAEAAESNAPWAQRRVACQELAEKVAAAMDAPPTPAPVVRARRNEWAGDDSLRVVVDFASARERILARRHAGRKGAL